MKRAQQFAIGDRVRHRDQPLVHGTVWSLDTRPVFKDRIIVAWDNRDENAVVLPEKLVKINQRRSQDRRGSRGQG